MINIQDMPCSSIEINDRVTRPSTDHVSRRSLLKEAITSTFDNCTRNLSAHRKCPIIHHDTSSRQQFDDDKDLNQSIIHSIRLYACTMNHFASPQAADVKKSGLPLHVQHACHPSTINFNLLSPHRRHAIYAVNRDTHSTCEEAVKAEKFCISKMGKIGKYHLRKYHLREYTNVEARTPT